MQNALNILEKFKLALGGISHYNVYAPETRRDKKELVYFNEECLSLRCVRTSQRGVWDFHSQVDALQLHVSALIFPDAFVGFPLWHKGRALSTFPSG